MGLNGETAGITYVIRLIPDPKGNLTYFGDRYRAEEIGDTNQGKRIVAFHGCVVDSSQNGNPMSRDTKKPVTEVSLKQALLAEAVVYLLRQRRTGIGNGEGLLLRI